MLEFFAGVLAVAAALVLPFLRSGPTVALELDGKAARFDGLRKATAEASTLKILTVHGMGNDAAAEPQAYSKAMLDGVARALGFGDAGPVDTGDLAHEHLPPGARPGRLATWSYRKGEKRIEVYSVQWSPLVAGIKEEWLLRSEAAHAGERVIGNRFLKKSLLNERLSDPVMYLGSMGGEIRVAIAQTVCRMTHGTWQSGPKPSCGGGNVPAGEKIAILTWSLGSKAAFDALAMIEETPDGERVVSELRTQTTHVFMFANQLPLLKLAEIGPKPTQGKGEAAAPEPVERRDTLAEFLERPLTKGAGLPPIEVIAISDPNDLLSYPIPEKYGERPELKDVHFVNVRTPVGRKLASGLAADALHAHTDHMNRPRVRQMLVEGWQR